MCMSSPRRLMHLHVYVPSVDAYVCLATPLYIRSKYRFRSQSVTALSYAACSPR